METQEMLKMFEQFKLVLEDLNHIKVNLQKPNDEYQSSQINELAAAMAKAQGEYKIVRYNRENPYFKAEYADLDAIIGATRPALSKYGVFFSQMTKITPDGATMLHTKLTHSSGQWIESRNRILPVKNDSQTYGSTLSYQKRYAAMAILGVAISHDTADDDAEYAMVESREIMAKGTSLNTKYNPKHETIETITKEQLDEFEYELAEYPDIAEQMLTGFKLQSLCDLPKSKYRVAIERVREIKNARNGIK